MWSVFFVFLSYLDRNFVKGDFLSRALDAEKESKEMFTLLNGIFCAKMSVAGENFLYQVSDGIEAVRSVVSPEGKVVNCSVIEDQMQVKSFMHECSLGRNVQRTGQQLDARFARMDEVKVMCQELKEDSERSGRNKRDDSDDSVLRNTVLKRSKRGFTYPGTLWCGAGNMADHYNQLGEFAETDSCCRTHDHCPHVIHAFTKNYGYTNFKFHSISQCDCDEKLKACLRKVNDTSSRVVGQAFFNVMGVPCFNFAYEDQCAERHWYGLCKRYEKFPIAVLKDAVPYDYGGIDVIDELPLPTFKQTDSNKSQKEDSETTTQPTMSGPEEPTLRNVVTAAEDFIKVLATVSTSQSSSPNPDKGETQSSEKKKRKNTGKKNSGKKRKGKGKWRKRKQKAEVGSKTDDGTAVLTSGSKGGVTALRNIIGDPHKHDTKNINRVGDSEYDLGRKEEPSNEVMKDEPSMDKEMAFSTSPLKVQKKPESAAGVDFSRMTNIPPKKAQTRRLKKGWRKKEIPSTTTSQLPLMNTTNNCVSTTIAMSTVTQPEQQSFESDNEKQLDVSTARTPIVSPKVKRTQSKESGDREWRKKRRKDSSASPIVAAPNGNLSAEALKVIPLTEAPTMPLASHRQAIYGRKMIPQDTALSSSTSVLKMKERRLKSSRRKTGLSQNSVHANENVLSVPPAAETNDSRISPTSIAAVITYTEETKAHSERFYPTITVAPSVDPKTLRQQRKSRKKPKPAAVLKQSDQTTVTFTDVPFKVTSSRELGRPEKTSTTSATPVLSPIQHSIEKGNAQFIRKKRRKTTMRQQ